MELRNNGTTGQIVEDDEWWVGEDLTKWLTLPDAASQLGITRSTVWKQVKAGRLQARRLGRAYFVHADAVGLFGATPRPPGRPRQVKAPRTGAASPLRAPSKRRLRFLVLERDHFRCRYCGRAAPDVVLHVDHVTPKSKGGAYEMSNLVAACEDCNMAKSDRLPTWLED